MSTATGPQPETPAPAPAGTTPGPVPQGVPRRRRGSWVDLVRTMLVVLAFVALIVLLVPRPGQLPRPAVDVQQAATGLDSQLGFAPLVPQGLPAGWQANSAETRSSTDGVTSFHIGYLTPEGLYAGVDQAASAFPRHWLDVNNAGGDRLADVTLDGVVWQQYARTDRQYTSLLLERPGRVVLVTTKQGGLATASLLARALKVPPA